MSLIDPHGNRGLVNRTLTGAAVSARLAELADAPSLTLSNRELSDLYLIGVGALSPLTGFQSERDYHSVVNHLALADGTVWPLPVTLAAPAEQAERLRPGQIVVLRDAAGTAAGTLTVADVYGYDAAEQARLVYRTDDAAHPGVAALYRQPNRLVGGDVTVFIDRIAAEFPDYELTPTETRARFDALGWRSVVAFQTRNPVHRAHEYLQKCALETVDGLLLHPVVGETKSDDIPAAVRMRCYEVLLERYFPTGRVLLAALPVAMRYAGPREAIFHAILRQNYGCTHFIVGRDHAGVGAYYGTYDAQHLFDELPVGGLKIEPLKYEHAFWCLRTGGMATTKSSPATAAEQIVLSGTKVREMLARGERPPITFTRPEVADILIQSLSVPVI